MNSWLIRAIVFLLEMALRIRYRITYEGLDAITKQLEGTKKGILFLPNHPAVVIDPLVVTLPLLKRFAIRPLIIEYMYYEPILYRLFRRIRALAIPNFSTGFNPVKLKRAEQMLGEMSLGLQQGENFLIYPSGTTKLTAKEHIGGAFGVHQLLTENPDVHVVLVRITGLWGSSFSRAFSAGDPVDVKKALYHAFKTVCKNLFFFVPKRDVSVQFELADDTVPRKAPKQELNYFLQQWYNKPFPDELEPLSLVSYSFWKKELLEPVSKKSDQFDLSTVPRQVKEKVSAKIAELSKEPKENVLPNLLLIEHLGLDSLDMAELISFLELEFDVHGIQPQDLTDVQRVYQIATKQYVKKEVQEKAWNKSRWCKKRSLDRLTIGSADTIVEAFFKGCDSRLFQLACADPRMGPVSYYKLKKSVLVLSEYIKKLPGDRIGILLPSSTMAMVLVLSCQYAKKTPVMINWTVGGRHLESVVEVSGVKHVLSSWAFLDGLENIDLSAIDPYLLMLEECRVDIGLMDMFKATLSAFLPSSCFSFSHIDSAKEAVLLFTSGTESMPKGVALTHANILHNLRAALDVVVLYADDVLLSFLPPFHSFGFSITGLLPLLCGLRVVFYPNPTESRRLSEAIVDWHVTVLCSAPSFLRNILNQGQQFDRIRLVITGAEKQTEELFQFICRKMPTCRVYDGYGITECSPVLTINTTSDRKYGVGKPLSNVLIKIVDPENLLVEKQIGEVGMIVAHGPNIFSGYVNRGLNDPFIELEAKRWYQTGDLGSVDGNGNLTISGRLKRFVKIGAEMVSLAAIEEALVSLKVKTKKNADVEQFVVVADESGDAKARLVLFSIHPLDLSQVNQVLRKYGFSNLVKIDHIVVVDAIEMTATGKVSYRALEQKLQEKS